MDKPHGLAYSVSDAPPAFLPLQSVSVLAQIIDVSARVEITQKFSNVPDATTAMARYLFPVPPNAAVCAFRLQSSSGREIEAVVKTLEEAKREYEEAVANDRWAGLLEKVAGDVFMLSVGSIPEGEDITVKITYIQELEQDDLFDQVRFHLQTYVGRRYGTPPAAFSAPTSSISLATISLTVKIQMASYIEKIASPSHDGEIIVSNVAENESSVYSSTVSFHPQYLDKDFVLTVRARDLHKPRCMAEVDEVNRTVALSLTHVPKFGADRIRNQEYIFVIDKSTSMGGDRIQNAKSALQILLKSLPRENTIFNVVWFSGDYNSLWMESQRYDDNNLQRATENIDKIVLSRGTEIEPALRFSFSVRSKCVPTSVFVLTDGRVDRQEDVFYCIKQAMRATNASPEAQLRVFCLGIGNRASKSLCQGIAYHGKGICEMAINSEEIPSKCTSLLRAADYPLFAGMYNISFDWCYAPTPPEKTTSNVRRPMSTIWLENIATPLPPVGPVEITEQEDDQEQHRRCVLQALSCEPSIFEERRSTAWAILLQSTNVPKEVLITGTLRDENKYTLHVPVQVVNNSLFLHKLGARRLITDLLAQRGQGSDELIKRKVEILSTNYQLASEFASFIAVDSEPKEEISQRNSEYFVEDEPMNDSPSSYITRESSIRDSNQVDASIKTIVEPVNHAIYDSYTSEAGTVPTARPSVRSESRPRKQKTARPVEPYDQSLRKTPSKSIGFGVRLLRAVRPYVWYLSDLCACCLCCSCCRRDLDTHLDSQVITVTESQMVAVASGISLPYTQRSEEPGNGVMLNKSLPSLPIVYIPVVIMAPPLSEEVDPAVASKRNDSIAAVAGLQSYDGSFELNDKLIHLLSGDEPNSDGATFQSKVEHIPESICDNPQAGSIWATILAVTYLKTSMSEDSDVWKGLWQKAKEYVLNTIGGDEEQFVKLVYDAESLFLITG